MKNEASSAAFMMLSFSRRRIDFDFADVCGVTLSLKRSINIENGEALRGYILQPLNDVTQVKSADGVNRSLHSHISEISDRDTDTKPKRVPQDTEQDAQHCSSAGLLDRVTSLRDSRTGDQEHQRHGKHTPNEWGYASNATNKPHIQQEERTHTHVARRHTRPSSVVL
jgi:hypothetical protein